jgi:plasmid stabilization system protein ParE
MTEGWLCFFEVHRHPRCGDALRSLGLRHEPRAGVRRLLLRRTRYHIYFVEEPHRVLVVAVWGANRGRGPDL